MIEGSQILALIYTMYYKDVSTTMDRRTHKLGSDKRDTILLGANAEETNLVVPEAIRMK